MAYCHNHPRAYSNILLVFSVSIITACHTSNMISTTYQQDAVGVLDSLLDERNDVSFEQMTAEVC